MRVGTPFGEYPFEFRHLERRSRSVAIVGIVAGLESSVVISAGDLEAVVRRVVLPVAAAALLVTRARTRSA